MRFIDKIYLISLSEEIRGQPALARLVTDKIDKELVFEAPIVTFVVSNIQVLPALQFNTCTYIMKRSMR